MKEYDICPNIFYVVKVILLAQDGETKYLQDFAQLFKEDFRKLLEQAQSKGIVLKSYKLPKEGSVFIPEDVLFNQNFLKKFYRSAFEMGEELFYTYPQSCVIQGQVFGLRSVSKRFDSLEQAFQKYAKNIKNNPELHQQIIDDIKWGIENQYSGFTTLDRFIIDRGWEILNAVRNGEHSNFNLEAIEMV